MTHRNYGTHGGRPSLGGQALERPHTALNTRADSNIYQFPSGSILADASGSPFERGGFSQSCLDILALGSLALIVCSLASAIGIFGYVFITFFFKA